jgi:hypothetical protein
VKLARAVRLAGFSRSAIAEGFKKPAKQCENVDFMAR